MTRHGAPIIRGTVLGHFTCSSARLHCGCRAFRLDLTFLPPGHQVDVERIAADNQGAVHQHGMFPKPD